MSADPKAVVIDMMCKGASPQLIATTMGLDITAILDIMHDPVARVSMANASSARLTQALDIDDLATQAEALTIARLYDAIAKESDTKRLASTFQILNKSNKRVLKPEEAGLANNGADVTVNLVLPARAVERRRTEVDYEMDAMGQVVSVDGRSLVTMNSTNVLQLAKKASPQIAALSEQKGEQAIVRMEDL